MPPVPAPPQDPSALPAATFGAAASPYVAGTVAPAAAATVAVAGLGAGTALTVGGLIEALERFAKMRFASAESYVFDEVTRQYPSLNAREVRALIEQEHRFEIEFRRKMQERLRRDLPKAFEISDPSTRLDALKAIFEREKRFTIMREEAMLLRALGKAEALLLRASSPDGAYWKLSPYVREHTLDCLAMGEKFWPWSVLENFQPPVHHGCQCYLLGLDEAIHAGLMLADQVPDPQDAEKRAKTLLKDAHDMMGEVPEDDLRQWMEEAVAFLLADETGENVSALDEARHGKAKRWAKGFLRGGQFMPERGGSSGRTRDDLRHIFEPMSPVRGKERGRGTWQWVDGHYVRVPHDTAWERRMGAAKYRSPAGSSLVYKDGAPLGPDRLRRSPGVADAPVAPNDIAERLREQMRRSEADDIERRVAARRAPLSPGDPAGRMLALEDAGFKLEGAMPHSLGTMLRWRNRNGATVETVFDGKSVRHVDFNPAPQVRLPRQELGRAPASFEEFTKDALAWADELGDRYNADVHVPEVRVARDLGDHAGRHQWSGEAEIGYRVPADIERAARARASGLVLNDKEARAVWSSYWVTAHEIAHGVNGIDPDMFEGGHANLEEALAEEVSHVLAVERLEEQGQADVLDWRERNPNALPVIGNYRNERFSLGRLLDAAGISKPEDRRDAVMSLKFEVHPSERMDWLAQRIHAVNPGENIDKIRDGVETAMADRPAQEGQAVPTTFRSPGRRAVGTVGYARFREGWMSRDGKTLHEPGGGLRRVETLPLMDARLQGMTDGSAIVRYEQGQEITDGLSYADGTAKSFRYLDSEDRARLVLRAFLGKGSPGDGNEEDRDDAIQRLERLPDNGYEWVGGVPVKRKGDRFAVGWKPTKGAPLLKARGAMMKAVLAAEHFKEHGSIPDWAVAVPASPGTGGKKNKIAKLLDDLLGHGTGLGADEDAIVADAIEASESPPTKKSKGQGGYKAPPDPLVGKKLGGGFAGMHAPDHSAIRDYSAMDLTLGKGAGGTQGARWAFDAEGGRWLVKHYKGDQDRVATELLGNAIYREVGAAATEAGTIQWPTGEPDFAAEPESGGFSEPDLPVTTKRISTGMIVVEPDGKLWIYEPKGHFGGYKHTFPKGGLEADLSPQQNAAKEVWEETGLRAEPVGFLGDFEGDTSVTRYYVARRTGGAPTTGKETAAVKLVTPQEAREALNRERDHEVMDALDAFGPVPPGTGNPAVSLPERIGIALTYPTKEGKVREHFKPSEALGEHYMTDALVANWDFVGQTGDNVLWTEDGTPIRLDQGGTFEMRAMGGGKPFGPVPTEVWTMLSKGQGKRGVIVDENSMREQAAHIGNMLPPAKVDEIVNQAPFRDESMRERVRENLKARVQWMADFADGKVDFPKPAEGDAARALFDAEQPLQLRPEEDDALHAWVEGMDKQISGVLRDKDVKLADAAKPVRKAVDALDGLMRDSKIPGDMIAWAGIHGSAEEGEKLVGKTVKEWSYLEANLDAAGMDHAVLLRLTIPEGSHALYTQDLGLEGFPATPELLIARKAKIQIAKADRTDDGRVVLHATVATEKSYPSHGTAPSAKGKGGYLGSGKGPGNVSGWQDKPKPPSKPKPGGPTQSDYDKYLGGWEQKKLGEAILQEAAAGHTSAMVALYPDPKVAKDMAVDDGEDPAEIHMTLAFLGKADALDGDKLKDVVKGWAHSAPEMSGEQAGIGTFEGGPDGAVHYASPDLPDLPEHRQRLVAALDAAGLPVSKEHGFTPHMTISYGGERPKHKARKLRFTHATVKLGDKRHDFPLSGGGLQEAAGRVMRRLIRDEDGRVIGSVEEPFDGPVG